MERYFTVYSPVGLEFDPDGEVIMIDDEVGRLVCASEQEAQELLVKHYSPDCFLVEEVFDEDTFCNTLVLEIDELLKTMDEEEIEELEDQDIEESVTLH